MTKQEGSSATDSVTDVTDIMKKEEGRRKKEEKQFNCFKLPIPNVQCQIPNSQFPMSNAKFPIPNSQCPMPNSQFPIVDVCCCLGYAAFKQYGGRFDVTQVYSGRKLWKAVASLDLRVKI